LLSGPTHHRLPSLRAARGSPPYMQHLWLTCTERVSQTGRRPHFYLRLSVGKIHPCQTCLVIWPSAFPSSLKCNHILGRLKRIKSVAPPARASSELYLHLKGWKSRMCRARYEGSRHLSKLTVCIIYSFSSSSTTKTLAPWRKASPRRPFRTSTNSSTTLREYQCQTGPLALFRSNCKA